MIFAVVAAAAPPPGVVTDDLTRWEAGSAALLAGPPGCWELTGTLALTAASYSPASRWTRGGREDFTFGGTFDGRLEDGRWTAFRYTLSRVDRPDEPARVDFPLFPTVGRIDPTVPQRTNPPPPDDSGVRVKTGDEEAINLLTRVLDDLHPETTTVIAEWDDEKRVIRSFMDVPVSDSPSAEAVTVETQFPEGGPATSLDATFPRRLKVGDPPVQATVYDGQVHLRAQAAGPIVVPALDSLSFGIGALGFTIAYEQKLVFTRATPCAAAPVAPEQAPPAE